jgi:dTDP-glucose pyrophosphorylase
MFPFTEHYPKPLLPIGNKPLLQHQIETVRDLGINEVLIVIGHLGHKIAQVFGDGRALGVTIRYVEQRTQLGIANAVGQLERHVASPLLLILGDIYFAAQGLERMLPPIVTGEASAVLAVKREDDPEAIRRNFAIIQNPDGRVSRVIEKPRYSTTPFKGCGVYLFDQHVFDAIRRTPRTAMRDEYEITESIQIMIEDGLKVLTSEVIQWDVNLTVPADLLRCNLFQLQRLGREALVGQAADVHRGARLENVILGDRVTVTHPVRIKDSLVFPDTSVTARHDIERFILTPEHEIDCRILTGGG